MIAKYEHFSSFVASLSRDIQHIERTEMGKFGLKGPHAQCLLTMLRHPQGITAARLCELCDKDKAAISRTVSELENSGMVRREKNNGSGYRAGLFLTEQGRKAAQAVGERAKMAVEMAGAGLTDEQREVFYRVLATIADNLHAICKNGLKEKKG